MGDKMVEFDEDKCLREVTANAKNWTTEKIDKWIKVAHEFNLREQSPLTRKIYDIVKSELDSRVDNA